MVKKNPFYVRNYVGFHKIKGSDSLYRFVLLKGEDNAAPFRKDNAFIGMKKAKVPITTFVA